MPFHNLFHYRKWSISDGQSEGSLQPKDPAIPTKTEGVSTIHGQRFICSTPGKKSVCLSFCSTNPCARKSITIFPRTVLYPTAESMHWERKCSIKAHIYVNIQTSCGLDCKITRSLFYLIYISALLDSRFHFFSSDYLYSMIPSTISGRNTHYFVFLFFPGRSTVGKNTGRTAGLADHSAHRWLGRQENPFSWGDCLVLLGFSEKLSHGGNHHHNMTMVICRGFFTWETKHELHLNFKYPVQITVKPVLDQSHNLPWLPPAPPKS